MENRIYTIHDLMEIIVVILNARDPYTFEHSWRVSALSEAIVDRLGIEAHWQEIIHIAAHLHDIGKIGVPDNILNKPGKLTDCEYKKVKEHAEIGFRIVNKLEALNEIALYVRHHHERWDGKGYPCGLKQKEIPLGARIIAVADTFDAISTSRPYHNARDLDYAFAEIERCSGTQLCSEVSSALLGMKDDIPVILKAVNNEIAEKNSYVILLLPPFHKLSHLSRLVFNRRHRIT